MKKFKESLDFLKEESNYKVEIEGLPTMFISASSPSEVRMNLRRLLKKGDMIKNIERVIDQDVRKHFRLKAQGKDVEEV